MRCKNCGWENPDGSQKCERCSSPLGESYSGIDNSNRYQSSGQPVNLRSTVREVSNNSYQPTKTLEHVEANFGGDGVECANCGYILSPSMNVCPQCGTSRKQESRVNEAQIQKREKVCPKCGGKVQAGAKFCPTCGQQLRNSGTVNAWDNPLVNEFCSLRPIAWARENIEYNAISFSGDRIVLNRANTDPNNQSITSREQAVLTYDGKDWYIEDLSDQHSTMLRVSKKTKLESGDVIALGNRLFEFKN